MCFVLLALVGCTTAGSEDDVPGSPAWFYQASPSTIAAYYEDRCRSFGIKPNTRQMALCVQSEYSRERCRADYEPTTFWAGASLMTGITPESRCDVRAL